MREVDDGRSLVLPPHRTAVNDYLEMVTILLNE